MSYEPRVRGSRFRRPPTKKRSAREKKTEPRYSFFPTERPQVSPSELVSKIVNALNHLGQQRFPLPPYSEHFERWTRDLQGILDEFKNILPQAADSQYRDSTQKAVSRLREELAKRSSVEASVQAERSALEARMNSADRRLSTLDQEYNAQVRETRRQYEKSFTKLRNDIGNLSKQRLGILRKKPTLLSRLFGKSDDALAASTNYLHAKKAAFDAAEKSLTDRLAALRADHEAKRDAVLTEQRNVAEALSKLSSGTLDDALEIRKQTCEELARIVVEASGRISADKEAGAPE